MRTQCNFFVSDRKGSFLHFVKLPPNKALIFIAFYFTDMWVHRSAMLELDITLNTSVYWNFWCSEVLENWVGHQEPIGGEYCCRNRRKCDDSKKI